MLESELFALLQGTTDAAFSVTEEGEILSWNKAAEKLLGIDRGPLDGLLEDLDSWFSKTYLVG